MKFMKLLHEAKFDEIYGIRQDLKWFDDFQHKKWKKIEIYKIWVGVGVGVKNW